MLPYVPRLLGRWAPPVTTPAHARRRHVAFVDISGFTTLTERLARKGKVGAEEMSDILSATFAGLLTEARADGADLVKWGGDAVLLLFQGPDHALRAAARRTGCGHAAHRRPARDRRPARSRCGCLSASTAATSTSSWSATRPSTASCWSAAPAASVTADMEAAAAPVRSP